MNSNADIDEGISSLSFSNKILWNKENKLGTVNSPKGNIWTSIGVLKSGKASVYSEEALFLAEFHDFEIIIDSSFAKPNSIFEILSIIKKDCGLISYKLFKNLKKHGYIMMRPECKYYPKPRLFLELPRGEYSLFKPSSSFKKTDPSGFIGHTLEIKQDDKIRTVLEMLNLLSGPTILAFSDEAEGFLFLEASMICPLPNRIELNNTQPKQLKSPKSILN